MRRARLSISNSKHIVVMIMEIVIFFLFLLAGERIWEYCIYDDTGEEARAVMYDFYHRENIDNLFLGSSHVYFDVDTALMDTYTEADNYNLSTPLQPLIASYYLLKEADRHYDIQNVYLEMYYGVSLLDSSILYNWRVYDYMPLSVNKLEYIMAAADTEERYLSFFRARRMWQNALDIEKVIEIVTKKQKDEYINHQWVKRNENGIEYFEPGGFLYTEYTLDAEECVIAEEPELISENPMSAEAEEYLRKILEYCKERNINIVLFCSPVTEYKLSAYEGYDNYYSQVSEIAAEYDRTYFDFNLCREETLDLRDRNFWRDTEHLNIWGAERFTSVLYQVLSTGADRNDYFYDSYEAKNEMEE